MKALSQNLGHSDVLTTFTSYGIVPIHKQTVLIRSLASERDGRGGASLDYIAQLADLVGRLQRGGTRALPDAAAGG